jgi:myo-inositol-1(or 4)-monophosphatase
VAAGRVDGFWEMGLKPWDTAASALLITEAGGRVGTLTGEDYKQGGHIVGGTPVFALVAALAPHVTDAQINGDIAVLQKNSSIPLFH